MCIDNPNSFELHVAVGLSKVDKSSLVIVVIMSLLLLVSSKDG